MLGQERLLTRIQAGMAGAYAARGDRERASTLADEAAARLERACNQWNTSLWEMTTPHLYYAVAVAYLRLEQADVALIFSKKRWKRAGAMPAGWRPMRK